MSFTYKCYYSNYAINVLIIYAPQCYNIIYSNIYQICSLAGVMQ